jgi:hypothetical protein
MLPRLRALLFATTLCSAPLAALAQTTVVGNWQGSMKVNGKDLHLVFHIHQATDGRYDALLDSLDQDAAGIPVTTVSFTGSTLIGCQALGFVPLENEAGSCLPIWRIGLSSQAVIASHRNVKHQPGCLDRHV